MGVCKVCGTEQPEVFDENPVCWSCGFQKLIDSKIKPTKPKEEKLNTNTNTSSHSEVELIF
jgi:hypothetical protein